MRYGRKGAGFRPKPPFLCRTLDPYQSHFLIQGGADESGMYSRISPG